MFEYTFRESGDPLAIHGTTTDFLQVLCEVTHSFGEKVAGEFTQALLESKKEDINCLRIIDWKFSYTHEGKSIQVHNIVH